MEVIDESSNPSFVIKEEKKSHNTKDSKDYGKASSLGTKSNFMSRLNWEEINKQKKFSRAKILNSPFFYLSLN